MWISLGIVLAWRAVCKATHCAYQTESRSSDGAKINRWRQDSHYQAMTRVRVCGIVMSTNGNAELIWSVSFCYKTELPRPEFLEPEQRLEEQEKATVIHRFTVLGMWLKQRHCLTFMATTMWQQSLTKHLANAMATLWPLSQRHRVACLFKTPTQ